MVWMQFLQAACLMHALASSVVIIPWCEKDMIPLSLIKTWLQPICQKVPQLTNQ